MKRYFLALIFLVFFQQSWGQDIFIDTVFFRFDSYQLQEENKVVLDSMSSILLKYPSYFVEIFGHTDSIGSTEYNLNLSEERARQVALYLVEQGVSLDRITYEGMGTTQPVASNETFEGRERNRRVDLSAIFTTEVFEPVVVVDSSELEVEQEEVMVEDPASLIDTVYCEYDFFDINPSHTTVIFTPQKTKLVIPPDAFDTEEEVLSVRMAELFSRRDMIVADQPTLSKDGPLEAAGMFSFEVRDGRRAARVRDGVKFDAVVPSSRRDRDMAVYSGRGRRRRSSRTGTLDPPPPMPTVKTWRETKNPIKYNGIMDGYVIQVETPGNYAISRPLYYALNAERDDRGVDFKIKFKGRRYEKTTQAMIVGEVVKTYIPLIREDKRRYISNSVKYLRDDTELILIGIQYDNRGRAYLAKLSFKPDYYLKKFYKKKKNRKKRPTIKMKVKFRRIDPERLEEILTDLNV